MPNPPGGGVPGSLTGTGSVGFVYRFDKKAGSAKLVCSKVDADTATLREQLFIDHNAEQLVFVNFIVVFGLIQSHAQAGPASAMSGDVHANGLGAVGVVEFLDSAGDLLPRCVGYLNHIILHPSCGGVLLRE